MRALPFVAAILLLGCADSPPDLLRVEVTDASGDPVAGAVVTLDTGPDTEPISSDETSSAGIAVLRGMPVDRAFRLTVDAGPRGATGMDDLRWSVGGHVPIRLPAVRTVTGRVLELGKNQRLTPAAGVELLIVDHAPAPYRARERLWHRSFTTDDDGRFSQSGVPAGVAWIELRGRDDRRLHGANAHWLNSVFPLPAVDNPPELIVARLGTITGRVVDASGQSVPGAEVVAGRILGPGSVPRAAAKSPVVTADAAGRFTITDQRVWRDGASVHARSPGVGEGSVRARALPGADVSDVVVTLGRGIPLNSWPKPPRTWPEREPPKRAPDPEPTEFWSGVVLDPEGRPVPLATVTRCGRRFGPSRECVADPAGRFRFPRPPAGFEYLLRARRGDLFSLKPLVGSDATTEFTLILHPGHAIEGRVVSGKGRAIAACRIEAVTPDPEIEEFHEVCAFDVTGDDGRFRLAGLAAGRYGLRISSRPSGWRGGATDVATGTTDLTIRAEYFAFECPFFTGGWLRAPEGDDPTAYRLRADPIGFRAGAFTAIPEPTGRFWIEGTPPGLWRITVYREGREPAVFGPATCGETDFEVRIR